MIEEALLATGAQVGHKTLFLHNLLLKCIHSYLPYNILLTCLSYLNVTASRCFSSNDCL